MRKCVCMCLCGVSVETRKGGSSIKEEKKRQKTLDIAHPIQHASVRSCTVNRTRIQIDCESDIAASLYRSHAFHFYFVFICMLRAEGECMIV